jgi:cytochrome c553
VFTSSLNTHRRTACWLAGAAAVLIALSFACTQKSAGPTRQAEKPVAATTIASCVSCHENLENEMITRVHARHGKTCADCHGQSTAHASGGSPQPSPDHTFAGNDIEKLCTQCHHRHNPEMIARTVQRRQGRLSPHGQPITTDSHCTDCHGHHVREG